MKSDKDFEELNSQDKDMDKRLDKLINQKKSESSALKKILESLEKMNNDNSEKLRNK